MFLDVFIIKEAQKPGTVSKEGLIVIGLGLKVKR
jgi:hypothetical protein